MRDIHADEISDGVVLVVYEAVRERAVGLWMEHDGRMRIRWHQGTRLPAEKRAAELRRAVDEVSTGLSPLRCRCSAVPSGAHDRASKWCGVSNDVVIVMEQLGRECGLDWIVR